MSSRPRPETDATVVTLALQHADDADVGRSSGWTFLSNHTHVLVCLRQDPTLRLRDIADRVGITERAATSIIGDLEADGYLTRQRVGRNNRYELHLDRPLRHPLEAKWHIGDLLDLFNAGTSRTARTRRSAP